MENEKKTALVTELKDLGTIMKQLEESCPTVLDPTKWTILRVDGHGFSKFSKRFDNPRDQRLIDAMLYAASQWLNEFHGVTCYVQSDEASLAVPPIDPNIPGSALMYNGRVSKIITLSASLYTVAFNKALPEGLKGVAYFDCRAFQVDSAEMMQKAFRWRQLDAFRNGISTAARMLDSPDIPKKMLEAYNTKDKLDLVRSRADIYGSDHLLHGTFVKKIKLNFKKFVRTGVGKFILGSNYTIRTPEPEWLAVKFAGQSMVVDQHIPKIPRDP